jgi:RHS repeat-associated protein
MKRETYDKCDNYGSTTYTWDQQSRLLSIWNPLNERTTMTWDNLDREQHRVLANGMGISHTWDAAGRETLIQNLSAAGAALFVATNTYSPVNNRLTVLETDGTRATFSYDASKQIISEARGGTMAYSRTYLWDPNGNRLQQYDNGVLTTGTFNAANQLTLLTPATGNATSSYYDGAGNLIAMNCGGALTTQTWSPENRLASYSDPAGNNEQFLYSDDGLKKQRVNGAGTTLFTYDEHALLLETDASLNLDARYTNRPKAWGRLVSQNRSGVSSFYGIDSQQCARILISMAGLVTDEYSWKAFGEPIQTGSGTINPYGYIANGLYYTEVVDLINAWNNWLKGSVGRWDSRDKLGFDSGSWNPYEYVGNNPVRWADPSGLAPCPKQPLLWCWACEYHRYWPLTSTHTEACNAAASKCGGTPCTVDCDDPPWPFAVQPHPKSAPPSRPPSQRNGQPGQSGPGLWGPVGGILVGGPEEYPFGTIINPEGDCMTACQGAAPRRMYPSFRNTTCEYLCHTLQATGCDGLWNWCPRYNKEHYRKTLCINFWKAIGCK